MAIVGGFLGGGVEMVPAGQSQLCLQWLTPDRQNLSGAVFTITGTGSTSGQYIVNGRADGRAEKLVPVGEYDIMVSHQGTYSNDLPQHVIAESTQSYLIYFGVQQESLSAVEFKTGKIWDCEYTIKDTEGGVFFSGNEWNKTMFFVIPLGNYILSLDGTEIPFSITASGIKEMDISEYICTVTMGTPPRGTSITIGDEVVGAVDSFQVAVSSKSHTLKFVSPSYDSSTKIATVNNLSFTPSENTYVANPTCAGTYKVFSEATTLNVLKGRFRVLAVGGGGGGGYGYSSASYSMSNGGGGGGGGRVSDSELVLEGSYPITIGKGGSYVSSGGATSLGSVISASGGSGGSSASSTRPGMGGSGGSGGGGGGVGYLSGSSTNTGGAGGNGEIFGGGGGGGGNRNSDGDDLSGGSGGTGGNTEHGAAGSGGSGARGQGDDGNSGRDGTVVTDSFYKGSTTTATGGTKGSGGNYGGGGGGGGGGLCANGGIGGSGSGSSSVRSGGGGGGGGGGCRGGTGGQAAPAGGSGFIGNGRGYGAGGGGGSTRHLYAGGGGGGGGGGGYGNKDNSESNEFGEFYPGHGSAGCIAIQWISRD